MKKRIIALLLAAIMIFMFSGCVVDIDFLKNGWDGVYEERERAHYVYPDPTVRTHVIREDYKVTEVNHDVPTESQGAGTGTPAATTSAPTAVAPTDAP